MIAPVAGSGSCPVCIAFVANPISKELRHHVAYYAARVICRESSTDIKDSAKKKKAACLETFLRKHILDSSRRISPAPQRIYEIQSRRNHSRSLRLDPTTRQTAG